MPPTAYKHTTLIRIHCQNKRGVIATSFYGDNDVITLHHPHPFILVPTLAIFTRVSSKEGSPTGSKNTTSEKRFVRGF